MSESSGELKVVLLISEGAWQRALAHRVGEVPGVRLGGIVIQHIASTSSASWVRRNLRRQPLQVASKVAQRLFFRSALQQIDNEAVKVFGLDGQVRAWPEVPMLEVDDINGAECVAWVRGLEPDVIAVSGTKIVKAPIFAIAPPRGLLNLHTGISPFYKGGPNCTLWCLAKGEPQFIGATLHVLDEGIDTGGILVTAQARVEEGDSAASLVCKAVALGHDLYARVLEAMARGQVLVATPQRELGEGRTYYTREWNVVQLARALRFVRSGRLSRWVRSGRCGLESVRLVDALEPKDEARR